MQEPEVEPEKVINKYTLKDPPDLRSKFLLEVERRDLAKATSIQRRKDEDIAEAIRVMRKNMCTIKCVKLNLLIEYTH